MKDGIAVVIVMVEYTTETTYDIICNYQLAPDCITNKGEKDSKTDKLIYSNLPLPKNILTFYLHLPFPHTH